MASVEAMNWVFMAGASSKEDAGPIDVDSRRLLAIELRARTMRRCSRAMSECSSSFENDAFAAAPSLLCGPAMKNLVLIAMTALSLAGCATQTADENEPAEDVDEQSEALRNVGGTGGTDSPENCLSAQQACYKSCAPSGSSSCYRYCDIVYTKCRGLPSPDLMLMR